MGIALEELKKRDDKEWYDLTEIESCLGVSNISGLEYFKWISICSFCKYLPRVLDIYLGT